MRTQLTDRTRRLAAALGATAAHVYKLMTEGDTIDKFYNILLGTPPPKNDPYPWGVCHPIVPLEKKTR